MGINTFKISAERKALELTCDSPSHRDNAPRAWFDSGSPSGSAWIADTVGWKEYRCKGATAWLCPRRSDARKASKLAPIVPAPLGYEVLFVNKKGEREQEKQPVIAFAFNPSSLYVMPVTAHG